LLRNAASHADCTAARLPLEAAKSCARISMEEVRDWARRGLAPAIRPVMQNRGLKPGVRGGRSPGRKDIRLIGRRILLCYKIPLF
jgi:hypothetical protein